MSETSLLITYATHGLCNKHASLPVGTRGLRVHHFTRSAFQYQKISLPKISLPKMSFGLVQSGWGESECFNKNLAPGSSEVFKDIFRAYRNAPQGSEAHCTALVEWGYSHQL